MVNVRGVGAVQTSNLGNQRIHIAIYGNPPARAMLFPVPQDDVTAEISQSEGCEGRRILSGSQRSSPSCLGLVVVAHPFIISLLAIWCIPCKWISV